MFTPLAEYIKSLEAINDSGTKDAKIKDLLDYYNRYTVEPGPGVCYGVIYARYSSHSQRDESIEGQVREDLEWAARNNVIVLGVYIDRALTGREADKRDSFQAMIADAAKRRFQFVICWKVDRFARNRYDAATYKARLKKYNIRVVYARENIPDGPEGILLESILEGQAEYYSASLSENVRRGHYDNALECKSNGGGLSLGYCIGEDKRFKIDPEGAAIVRKIFELYANGQTYKQIEDYLNSHGYKTSRGKPFNKCSFQKILRNKRYIGIYQYKDIIVEGGMPVIIGKELFEAVQHRLDKNAKARGHKRGKVDYLLTTKIFCGLCGRPMIGESGTSQTGAKYHYYACTGRKRHKDCGKTPVHKDWIEDLVVHETIRLILRDDIIQEIADHLMAYQAKEQDTTALRALQAKLADVEKSIKNLLAAIEQGIFTASTKERMEELEQERIQIKAGIAEESMAHPLLSRNQIVFFLQSFRDGEENDPAYRKKLIDALVNAVYVFEHKIVITYNHSGPHNTSTLDEINLATDGLEGIIADGCEPEGFGSTLLTPTIARPSEQTGLFIITGGFGVVIRVR